MMRLTVLILCAVSCLTLSASPYAEPLFTPPYEVDAQPNRFKVTGLVVDQEGTPIIGATVMEKGVKNNGTLTDANGNFTLQLHSANAHLEVSYLGYQAQTVRVTPGKTLRIVLHENSEQLDEVLVVAFGKQKRESFTGSAAVVKSEKIAERQVDGPIAALNGKVAGVQMLEGNGPNADVTIRVRGISSINAGNSPLIVLDGLPYNGYYNDINPQDVESVTVLKDAASNALYGARGANGVILITTKSAKRGRAVVSFDAKWGSSHNAKVDYDYIKDPGQYYEAYYQALYNYNRNALGQNAYDAFRNANNTLGLSDDVGGLGYISYSVPEGEWLIGENGRLNPNAKPGNVVTNNGQTYTILPDDWKKEGLRNGLRQEYTLNVNGGSDQFQFYGSLGYMSNEGITYGSDYSRYTARIKADYQARPWLKLGANMSYTHNENSYIEMDTDYKSNIFAAIYEVAPIYPMYMRDGDGNIMTDAHGKMYDYGDGTATGVVRAVYKNDNPVQQQMVDYYNNNSNAFGLQGYADITFLKDFKLTLNASVYDTENRIITAINPYYSTGATTGGSTSTGHYRTYSLNLQQLLNYNKTFGNHTLSLLLGHEYNRDSYTTLIGTKSVFYSYATNVELDGAMNKSYLSGYSDVYNIEGYFLRANYDYDNKYFASFSFRRDGSSRFHPSHCWGNFWSLGGAWIVSKENWFKSSWIDMLKLKASYGQQGNDNLRNDYRETYYYDDYYTYEVMDGEPAYAFGTKGKRDISWETNTNFNVGVEFELFKRRLNGGVEFYSRKTTDMLLKVRTPASLGYTSYYSNVGDMINRGIEVDLNGDVIRTKNITWNINLNLAHNYNEVSRLNDENKTYETDGYYGYISGTRFIGEGLPYNTYRLRKYAGVAEDGQSQWYYTDENGDLQKTTDYAQGQYYLCGDPNPSVYGGFGTTINIYGFDLSANFIYSIGGKAIDYGYMSLMSPPTAGYTGFNYHKDVLKGWSAENPNSDIPRWQYNDIYAASNSDRWLTDASCLTFKNISVGYTFPTRLIRALQLTKLRLYVSCDNVAYWSKRKGFDPRTSLTGAIYGSGYSPARTISGGISVQF